MIAIITLQDLVTVSSCCALFTAMAEASLTNRPMATLLLFSCQLVHFEHVLCSLAEPTSPAIPQVMGRHRRIGWPSPVDFDLPFSRGYLDVSIVTAENDACS